MQNEPQIWGEKRYRSLNYHLRSRFGQKVFKIPLDAGFTCPNRDGTYSNRGCYFCSPRGSGDFAASRELDIIEQFKAGKAMMNKKWKGDQYIAYLQAFSNTYAPVSRLRKIYGQVMELPGVVGVAIATRPDCLGSEVLSVLEEMNQKTYLWVELGLQTIHEKTARRMNLHYNYEIFKEALGNLNDRHIETCAHIILGLPGESREEMLKTGFTMGRLPLQGLKIHLLHLMRGTPLEKLYDAKGMDFLTQEEYVDLVCLILERMPPNLVIHRLTGDSPRDLLIDPQWSLNKWQVLNAIDDELKDRHTWQGRLY